MFGKSRRRDELTNKNNKEIKKISCLLSSKDLEKSVVDVCFVFLSCFILVITLAGLYDG